MIPIENNVVWVVDITLPIDMLYLPHINGIII